LRWLWSASSSGCPCLCSPAEQAESFTVNFTTKCYITLTPEAIFLVVCDPSMNEL
jgi:hypothetical protein